MGLPFNPYQPESQLIQYHPQSLPFLMPVSFNPQYTYQIQNYLPIIQATLMNEATSRSGTNAGRMFTFNALSSNGWQNQFFSELMHMTVAGLIMAVQRGAANNYEQILNQVCSQMVGLYVSKMIMEFMELKQITDQNVVNAAFTNTAALNSALNDARSLAGQSPQGMMPGAYNPLQQGNFPGGQSMMGNRNYGTFPQNSQNMQAGLSRGNQPMFNQQQPQSQPTAHNTQRAYAAPSGAKESPLQQKNFFAPQQVVEDDEPEILSKEDWRPSYEQSYRFFIDKRFFDKTYQYGDDSVIEVIEEKGDVMERDKHVINMFGKSYPLDGLRRTKALEINANELSALTGHDLRDSLKEDVSDEVYEHVTQHIYPKMQAEIFLDAAIFQGRLRQIQKQPDNTETNVYRTYSTVFTPVLLQGLKEDILTAMPSPRSFTELARTIRSTANLYETKYLENTVTDAELADVLMVLSALNRNLTDRINSFLKNNLSIGVTIGDFSEDVEGLHAYLDKQYGPLYASAYQTFEFEAIGSINVSVSKESRADLMELADIPENQPTAFIPTIYSMTYVNVHADELGLASLENEAELLTTEYSAILFTLADSLFSKAPADKAINACPAYNLLITQDGQVFKLYRGYLAKEAYLISR